MTQIPWGTLVFVLAGYGFFGALLGLLSAPVVLWLLTWLGSIGWVLNEALIWFTSLIGAIAVILAAGVSIWILGIAGVVTISLFFCLKFVLDRSLPSAMKDSMWVGGLGIVAMTLWSWLGEVAKTTSQVNSFYLGLLLIAGIVCAALGSIAPLQLHPHKFSFKQTIVIMAGLAGVGLIVGNIIQLLVQR